MHEEMLDQAEALYERKKYKQAAALYREMLHLRPDHARAHQQLASCLLHLNNPSEAEQEARAALKLDAQLPLPHAVLGYILTQKQQLEDAAILYRRALELEPQNLRYSATLAWILASQGKHEEGLDILRPFEELAHKEPSVHQSLSFIFKKQNLQQQANQEAWKAFRLAPSWVALQWLIRIRITNNPFAMIIFAVLFMAAIAIPSSISYSKSAILISIFLVSVFLVVIVSGIYFTLRSGQKNRKLSVGFALLIFSIYFYTIYAHWTQPLLSGEMVQIRVSTFDYDSPLNVYIMQPSIKPPFFQSIPASYLGVRTTVVNHLDVPVHCSITDKNSEPLFITYSLVDEFEAPPGESVKEIVIQYTASNAKLWWVRCGNDLSSMAVPINLTLHP